MMHGEAIKKCEGYQPDVASIGKNIVCIEGRNGNSPAKYQQEETLTRAFSLLDQRASASSTFGQLRPPTNKRYLVLWRERVSTFTSELCVALLWNSKLARFGQMLGRKSVLEYKKWKT